MNLFRIKTNPSGGAANKTITFKYCLDNCLLGIGWRVPRLTSTKDWSEYESKAENEHGEGNINPPKYIEREVKRGDLVWTRGVGEYGGNHYLARVKSEWEYWYPEEASRQDIDIANIFRCDNIYEIEADEVPGAVVASFTGYGNSIQRVYDVHTSEYSMHLWNKVSGKDIYKIDKSKFPSVFGMLTAEEAEDVLFMYLQHQGWYVIPNSRKGSTMKFEFLLTCPKTGKYAKTQVKVGETEINREEYKEDGTWFLFQLNGHYTGAESENVICVSQNDVLEFLKASKLWLPGWLKRKAKMAKS